MSVSKDIDKLLDEASRIGWLEVERLARAVMAKHKNVVRFTMAMGVFSFYDENGLMNELKYMEPVCSFIYEFDRYLQITGMPMWIEGASGVLKTDW